MTNEQLQAWREEFESAWPGFYSAKTDGIYDSDGREDQWQDYQRAKQETEQAIKDARKQALEEAIAEAILWANGRHPHSGGLALSNYVNRLKELLND